MTQCHTCYVHVGETHPAELHAPIAPYKKLPVQPPNKEGGGQIKSTDYGLHSETIYAVLQQGCLVN